VRHTASDTFKINVLMISCHCRAGTLEVVGTAAGCYMAAACTFDKPLLEQDHS